MPERCGVAGGGGGGSDINEQATPVAPKQGATGTSGGPYGGFTGFQSHACSAAVWRRQFKVITKTSPS